MKKILVTGIGGLVGQGILRSIKDMSIDVELIGTNIIRVTSGNYLCHKVYKVPFAYEPGYIDQLIEICTQEKIDLIIPSTDYETYYLALNKSKFNCTIACSPLEFTELCLDKYSTYVSLKRHDIPFAQSILPSQYKGEFAKAIVKPREGRGSRNVFRNPKNIFEFKDDYVVQPMLEGPEITTAFYVTKAGQLHGQMSFIRSLESGGTSEAEVTTDYDKLLEPILLAIAHHFPVRGSCNIQSIVTNSGIVPFEINCRISGTNAARHQFGFKDVVYTVQEYLLNQNPELPNVIKGCVLRVKLDLIYKNLSLKDVSNNSDSFYIS